MVNRQFMAAQLSTLAMVWVLSGCAQSTRPETFPVHGKVTYQGKPVADASVAFLAPGAPRLAVGMTDAAGHYRLTTFQPDDGAIAGTHSVTVSKYAERPGPAYTAAPDGKIDSAAIDRAMQEAAVQIKRAQEAGSELPEKYADLKTSDLHFEVREAENVVNIELVD